MRERTVYIKLPMDVYDALKRCAKAEDRSASAQARNIIRQAVEEERNDD